MSSPVLGLPRMYPQLCTQRSVGPGMGRERSFGLDVIRYRSLCEVLIRYWGRSSWFQSSPSEQSHRVDGRVPVGAGGSDSAYLEPLGCVIPEGLLQPLLSFPVSPQQLIHLFKHAGSVHPPLWVDGGAPAALTVLWVMGRSSTSLLHQLGVGIASLAQDLWCRRGWQCPQEGSFESRPLCTFALAPRSPGHRVEGGRQSPGRGLPLAKSLLVPAHFPSGLISPVPSFQANGNPESCGMDNQFS